jgi:hypothetical protein
MANEMNGADRELEDALRGLKPADARIDPLECAFHAGQHAAQKRVLVWRSTCAALAIALSAAILMPLRSATPSREHVASPAAQFATTTSTTPIREPETLSDISVLRLRNVALEHGIDATPRSSGTRGKSLSVRDGFPS